MTPTPKEGGWVPSSGFRMGRGKNAFRSTIHAAANLPGDATFLSSSADGVWTAAKIARVEFKTTRRWHL